VSDNGHEDIAARLRREAGASAPERLRADVMLRVHAEPRPQRIRPRRSFGRSFASLAAAACVLGALVFGMSRVDFGGNGSVSGAGGGSAAAEKAGEGLVSKAPQRHLVPAGTDRLVLRAAAVPRPLHQAIFGRAHLAAPLRKTFGALDPYHPQSRR
jgi:hypothetical protein